MKKADVQVLLDGLEDELDPEELMYRLYLKAKLERAEAALARGDVVSHEEVVRQSKTWFPSNGQDQP